ncbi:hypothetical protein Ate01nite_38630 [Actinoplanes teichomyceticus]|nr:hypothetical protein Ate01nite_38630 [Actinoplanes teichomyceticus]
MCGRGDAERGGRGDGEGGKTAAYGHPDLLKTSGRPVRAAPRSDPRHPGHAVVVLPTSDTSTRASAASAGPRPG